MSAAMPSTPKNRRRHNIPGTYRDSASGLFIASRACCERVARRGGNYNNTSNAGMAYLNCNNPRSNANVNYGARPRSQSHAKDQYVTHGWRHIEWEGYVSIREGFLLIPR